MLGLWFWDISQVKNEPSSSTTSSGSTNAQETAPQREVFSTTARQLFKAYDENEVATDEKNERKINFRQGRCSVDR
ncbi:hypothetical protein ACP0HM_12230 [Escherichia coli]